MSKRLPVTFSNNRYDVLKKTAEKEGISMAEVINKFVKILEFFDGFPEFMIVTDSMSPSRTLIYHCGNKIEYATALKIEQGNGECPKVKVEAIETNENGEPVVLFKDGIPKLKFKTIESKINKGGESDV